jgi:hypothetical protein
VEKRKSASLESGGREFQSAQAAFRHPPTNSIKPDHLVSAGLSTITPLDLLVKRQTRRGHIDAL